jgi:Ca2+-binding EF-hand superfamily protein
MNSSKVVKKVPKVTAFRKEENESKSGYSSLQKSVVMDTNDSEETNKVIQAFKSFDLDGDGYISVREFVSMLNSYSVDLTPKDIDEIVKVSKLDVKGKMDY